MAPNGNHDDDPASTVDEAQPLTASELAAVVYEIAAGRRLSPILGAGNRPAAEFAAGLLLSALGINGDPDVATVRAAELLRTIAEAGQAPRAVSILRPVVNTLQLAAAVAGRS